MLSKSDIEKPRSPQDLHDFVCQVVAAVRQNEIELPKAHLGHGLYRVFKNEIVPLSIFTKLHYVDDVLIKPILGNQGFDAEVFTNNGCLIERIEITNPHNGTAAHENAKLLVLRGFGKEDTFDPGENFTRMFHIIRLACEKKSLKDYSNNILVISVDFTEPFEEHHNLYFKYAVRLQREFAKIEFKSKQVYLLLKSLQKLLSIKPLIDFPIHA